MKGPDGEVGVVGEGGMTSEMGDMELSPSDIFPLDALPPDSGGFSEMGEKMRWEERLAVETAEEAMKGEGEEQGLGEGVQRSQSPEGPPTSSNSSSLGRFTASSTLQQKVKGQSSKVKKIHSKDV